MFPPLSRHPVYTGLPAGPPFGSVERAAEKPACEETSVRCRLSGRCEFVATIGNDECCVRILRNCRGVLQRGARLIVIDRVTPEKPEPKAGNLSVVMSDLNMLSGIGGCERTEGEFRDLLAKGGFRMECVVPAGRYCLIEASAE